MVKGAFRKRCFLKYFWQTNLIVCYISSFQELLSKECLEVPLINPVSENLRRLKPQKEASFGVLLPFNDDYLVTYNSDVVYVLDPKQMSVICCISSLRKYVPVFSIKINFIFAFVLSVLDVATYKDELFILEGERNLIRISYKPENIPGITQKSYIM